MTTLTHTSPTLTRLVSEPHHHHQNLTNSMGGWEDIILCSEHTMLGFSNTASLMQLLQVDDSMSLMLTHTLKDETRSMF